MPGLTVVVIGWTYHRTCKKMGAGAIRPLLFSKWWMRYWTRLFARSFCSLYCRDGGRRHRCYKQWGKDDQT